MLKKIKMFALIMKGGTLMVDIYVALIVNKRRTIEQVPTHLQTQVLADLKALGLDGYGNPITVA